MSGLGGFDGLEPLIEATQNGLITVKTYAPHSFLCHNADTCTCRTCSRWRQVQDEWLKEMAAWASPRRTITPDEVPDTFKPRAREQR